MKSILFRADANPSIGIGDLMSLITLSQYFNQEEWSCYFMIRSYPTSLKLAERIDKNYLTIVDYNCSIGHEVEQINLFCIEQRIDLLFFEITERPLSEYSGLGKAIKKACINFNTNLLNDLSLVVNWDVDAINYMEQGCAPNANFLLGPEYAILPMNFFALKKRTYKTQPKTVLVAMGGADEYDLTFNIAQCMVNNQVGLSINIVVGPGYQGTNRLKKLLEKSSLKWKIKHDVKSMLNEYLNCDVAIGSGGLTASELVATKTPAMLVATYKHQVSRCKYFHEIGCAIYLGYRSFDSDTLLSGLKSSIVTGNHMVFRTHKIVEMVNKIVGN